MTPLTITPADTAPADTAPAETPPTPRLTSIVKAYDVRGIVGEQLTSAVAEAIGWAFGRFVYDEADDPAEPRSSAVVIGTTCVTRRRYWPPRSRRG